MGSYRIKLLQIIYIAGIGILTVVYLMIWMPVAFRPSSLGNTDFLSYYAVGRIAQQSGFSHVYDIGLQQKIEEQVLNQRLDQGRVLIYIHVPYMVIPLRILVSENYLASYLRWALVMVIIYTTGIYFFINTFFEEEKNLHLAILAGAITFFPFFISVLQGQDTAFVLFGVAMWCVGMKQENDWLSGLGLAMVSGRPHMCIALSIPVILRFRKVFWKFFLFGTILSVISFLTFGVNGLAGFINILAISASGRAFGMDETSMLNLTGLLERSFLTLDPVIIRVIGWASLAIGTGFLIIFWLHAKQVGPKLLGISVLLSLFIAPHLYYHDLAILIIPLLLAIKTFPQFQEKNWEPFIFLSASFPLLASFGNSTAYFTAPYILASALVWLLWRGRTVALNH